VNNLTGEASADPWDSGEPEFEPGAGRGHISSGELMAWVAMVGVNAYDAMREQMMATEQRAELQEDLGHVLSKLEKVIANNLPENFDELEKDIRAVMAKYKGTVLEEKVNALFGERLQKLEASREARRAEESAKEGVQNANSDGELLEANARWAQASEEYNITWKPLAKELESWKTDIEAKRDKLGTEEQLSMIRVQELNARITQTTQAASSLLAAQSQTTSAVIMNIKA
jgi:hypothetical protein